MGWEAWDAMRTAGLRVGSPNLFSEVSVLPVSDDIVSGSDSGTIEADALNGEDVCRVPLSPTRAREMFYGSCDAGGPSRVCSS